MQEDKRAKQSLILLAVCLVGFIGVEIGYGNWLRGISNDKKSSPWSLWDTFTPACLL